MIYLQKAHILANNYPEIRRVNIWISGNLLPYWNSWMPGFWNLRQDRINSLGNVISVLFPSSHYTMCWNWVVFLRKKKDTRYFRGRKNSLKGSESFPTAINGMGEPKLSYYRGGVSVKGTFSQELWIEGKNLYFIGEVLDLDAVTGGYKSSRLLSDNCVSGSQLKKWMKDLL